MIHSRAGESDLESPESLNLPGVEILYWGTMDSGHSKNDKEIGLFDFIGITCIQYFLFYLRKIQINQLLFAVILYSQYSIIFFY